MARGRFISKSFSTSKKRGALFAKHGTPCPHCGGSLAEFAQALYLLLVPHADDHGRQDGDPFTVQKVVDPLTPRPEGAFIAALQALGEVGLVRWYTAGKSRQVLSIEAFDEHQGLRYHAVSKFPEFPATSGNARESSETSGALPKVLPEEKRSEVKRREEVRATAPRRARPPANGARPNVKTLAAMVLKEVLPLGLKHADIPEAVKERAAKHLLPYDGRSVASAISSAMTQARKSPSTKGARP